ncbi:MAG: hypothetical protein IJA13_02880, partial [Clostridia bacterium]|nr:hypothetical protein [Clostridia bacterium]
GKYYEPTFYTKVADQHGDVILEANTKPKIAMMEDTAVILNHMLQNVVNQGTGTSIKSYLPKMKVFGKTGTTDDNYNLWFAGGTPYYVASCWYGYDQQEKVSESGAAKRVWGSIMKDIHKGLSVDAKFPESNYVTCRRYCTSSGMLATEKCSSTAIGWYKTSQLKPCTTHGGSVMSEVDLSQLNSSSNASSGTSSTASSTTSTTSANTSKPAVSSATVTSSKPSETTNTTTSQVTSTEQTTE